MYFHVYLIYRFTRTFTDHSSVITRCWGFELQNGKSSLKSPQTLATQDFAPASFLSTPDNKYLKSSDFRCFFVANVDFFVWVKMWGSGLTHTVTHTRKGNNGHKSAGREDLPSRPAFFSLSYMTCSMKLPMVWVASSCFCLVAWV